ncbi:YhjD [Bacillus sp. ZZV12-4809]|nr:YhjD [Bacillus sp. ZZV12-4809]
MTRIPEEDRNIMEQAIYLPMVLTVLNRDSIVINKSPFKLKQPYLDLVEETMKVIQSELSEVKRYMNKNQLKVQEIKRDEAFTMFMFLYKGYEEHHNYFNPRIRNKVQELMTYYLLKRSLPGSGKNLKAN